MNRILKNKYSKQDKFEQVLKDGAGADENGNLNVDDFKAFLVDQCREELIARKVTKQDIEGFMSAFVYNKHGGTDIKGVAPLVYEPDANKLSKIITQQVRANPPPAVMNQDLYQKSSSIEINNSKAIRLRSLLNELENKTFQSKPRMYKAFTTMDVDGDGFVNYKDFEAHLIKNKINASQDEILALMHGWLDVDRRGYIDFTAFQKKFGPGMSS